MAAENGTESGFSQSLFCVGDVWVWVWVCVMAAQLVGRERRTIIESGFRNLAALSLSPPLEVDPPPRDMGWDSGKPIEGRDAIASGWADRSFVRSASHPTMD